MVSKPAEVIAVRLKADRKGALNFTAASMRLAPTQLNGRAAVTHRRTPAPACR